MRGDLSLNNVVFPLRVLVDNLFSCCFCCSPERGRRSGKHFDVGKSDSRDLDDDVDEWVGGDGNRGSRDGEFTQLTIDRISMSCDATSCCSCLVDVGGGGGGRRRARSVGYEQDDDEADENEEAKEDLDGSVDKPDRGRCCC